MTHEQLRLRLETISELLEEQYRVAGGTVKGNGIYFNMVQLPDIISGLLNQGFVLGSDTTLERPHFIDPPVRLFDLLNSYQINIGDLVLGLDANGQPITTPANENLLIISGDKTGKTSMLNTYATSVMLSVVNPTFVFIRGRASNRVIVESEQTYYYEEDDIHNLISNIQPNQNTFVLIDDLTDFTISDLINFDIENITWVISTSIADSKLVEDIPIKVVGKGDYDWILGKNGMSNRLPEHSFYYVPDKWNRIYFEHAHVDKADYLILTRGKNTLYLGL